MPPVACDRCRAVDERAGQHEPGNEFPIFCSAEFLAECADLLDDLATKDEAGRLDEKPADEAWKGVAPEHQVWGVRNWDAEGFGRVVPELVVR